MKRIKEERPDIATVIVLPTVGRQAGRQGTHGPCACHVRLKACTCCCGRWHP